VSFATAYVQQNRPIALRDPEDFDRLRAATSHTDHLQRPFIITFEVRNRVVYLGLAKDLGFVHVTSVSNAPPYVITVGERAQGGNIEFFLHGEHHTEIEARHLIPADHAWTAVRKFLESGQLLPSLKWEEV